MGIQIKLQIEIDDVEDAQLLRAIESLLKTAKQTDETDSKPPLTDVVEGQQRRRKPPKPRFPDGSPTERFNQFCAACRPARNNLSPSLRKLTPTCFINLRQ